MEPGEGPGLKQKIGYAKEAWDYLRSDDELRLNKKFSVAMDKMIQEQPKAWYNWLSRKTSEFLFGKEFPLVADEVKQAVGVLNLPDVQRRYLEAYQSLQLVDTKTKDNLFPAFARSAQEMRKRITPNNTEATFFDVNDRMHGLITSSTRTLMLTRSKFLTNKNGFSDSLKTVSEGMVDRDTKFFSEVRRNASRDIEPTDDGQKITLKTLLNLSPDESRYVDAYFQAHEGFTGDKKNEVTKEVADSVEALRSFIDKDNPNSPDVGDRMDGLIMASEQLLRLMNDEDVRKLPNYASSMRNAANGLVEKETKFFKDFRSGLE